MNIKSIVLGPMGTYSHQVALSVFDYAYTLEFVESNTRVLSIVGNYVDCEGVVAIENSTGGIVREVVDFWMETEEDKRPVVVGDINLPVRHSLVCHPDARMVDIDTIVSHPQALAQCRKTLSTRWSRIKRFMPADSTAAAAKDISVGNHPKTWAAIASSFAAEQYGLRIIDQDRMQDSSLNTTRFHLIMHRTKAKEQQSSYDPTKVLSRTAVIFRLKDEPHALMHTLWHIKVNMSSIHSIPLGQPGKYAFYVEFAEHSETEKGKEIMKGLRAMANDLIHLGSFPQVMYPREGGLHVD